MKNLKSKDTSKAKLSRSRQAAGMTEKEEVQGSKLPRPTSCFVHVLTKITNFPVPMRPGVTPVPIPNTKVKPRTADGTMLETAWESRWAPESLWGCSSVGRAPALQAGGQGFESLHLHSEYISERRTAEALEAKAVDTVP